jgi:hypothetical protein
MSMEYTEISEAGVVRKVPSTCIDGRKVIVTGRWLSMASVEGEEYQQGDVVPAPKDFVAVLKDDLRPDVFTFRQKPDEPTPRFPYFHELESVAVIRVSSYEDWWTNKVSTDLRCDVRKAAKRGVVVRPVAFDDEFVKGVVEIYNETPIRQGRPFWHYGKSFDAVKRENGTFNERSDFLGAFVGEELIGFVKIVYVDRVARLLQVIAKMSHWDKRPLNILIAKAVERCEAKGCSMLTYGRYRYSQETDSLSAFKRRNGFEEILVPKYYIPLTIKGRAALSLRVHHGARRFIPPSVLKHLKRIRAYIYGLSVPRMAATTRRSSI